MNPIEPDSKISDNAPQAGSMLIIDRPELVKSGERLSAWGITLFFWGVLLYLWQPALSLLAWAFNIKLFYQHMVVLGGFESFLSLLKAYAIVIACLGGALLLWAKINELRFRGTVRRAQVSEINTHQLAEYFSVSQPSLVKWQAEKVLFVQMSNSGQVTEIHNKK
jgi:biofilm PGA synthesis protein PgaD